MQKALQILLYKAYKLINMIKNEIDRLQPLNKFFRSLYSANEVTDSTNKLGPITGWQVASYLTNQLIG